jgi:hypothetical protein
MELINSKYRFSLYTDIFNVEKPEATIDINQLCEVVKYGYLKNEIAAIQTASNEEEAKRLKLTLPCVTLSGIFSHRDKNSLVKHSGLLQIDIDHVEDYSIIFQKICKDDYTYVCFRSPRGKGIKVIFKIEPNADTHLNQFLAIEKYFRDKFKVEIDTSCKDLARPMLLSFDPNIYCNPNANVFTKKLKPKKKKPAINKQVQITNPRQIEEDVLLYIKELESRKIDITESYDDWIRIGYAFASEFGEQGRDYFIRVSAIHQKFREEECSKKFDYLLVNNNNSVNIATFFYLVKVNGIN